MLPLAFSVDPARDPREPIQNPVPQHYYNNLYVHA